MFKRFSILTRGVAVAALVGVAALGTSAHTSAASDRDWTIKFPNWNPTQPWIVEESVDQSGKLSGTVMPPNPNCGGTISGTWNIGTGSLNMTFTYGGTCKGETSVLIGQQSKRITRGEASDNIIGINSKYSGTSSKSSPVGGSAVAAACGATAACWR